MSLADELLADLDEPGDELGDEDNGQVWLLFEIFGLVWPSICTLHALPSGRNTGHPAKEAGVFPQSLQA